MANIILPKPWALKERDASPEAVYLNRRKFIKGMSQSLIAAGVMSSGVLAGAGSARASTGNTVAADLYPAERNVTYGDPTPWTPEDIATTYNNFYEFGSHKQIARAAQALQVSPWTVVIDGEVSHPLTIDAEDLIRRMPIEERVYRLRCVEAWSMVVPWTGFPFKALLDLVEPTSRGKFVRMETFMDASVATGQKQRWYPWPYVEGLTIEEAAHDLTFLVTGAYGKPVPKQMGAPIRLAVPWKYGFKSIKSIVRITLTEQRPVSFWEELAAEEYGFWANVNPEVAHPRWSQATERDIATGDRKPTSKWNGYGEWVAGLYPDSLGEASYR